MLNDNFSILDQRNRTITLGYSDKDGDCFDIELMLDEEGKIYSIDFGSITSYMCMPVKDYICLTNFIMARLSPLGGALYGKVNNE